MADLYPLREMGLQALEKNVAAHARLVAKLTPVDTVLAMIDELQNDDPQKECGVDLQPSRDVSRIAGPVFIATHRDVENAGEASPLTVRTDEAGLYIY